MTTNAELVKRLKANRQDPDVIHRTNEACAEIIFCRIQQSYDSFERFDARTQDYIARSRKCPADAYAAQDLHERVLDLMDTKESQ